MWRICVKFGWGKRTVCRSGGLLLQKCLQADSALVYFSTEDSPRLYTEQDPHSGNSL